MLFRSSMGSLQSGTSKKKRPTLALLHHHTSSVKKKPNRLCMVVRKQREAIMKRGRGARKNKAHWVMILQALEGHLLSPLGGVAQWEPEKMSGLRSLASTPEGSSSSHHRSTSGIIVSILFLSLDFQFTYIGDNVSFKYGVGI